MRCKLEQKIKQDNNGNIGKNIQEVRITKGIAQMELVRLLDLQGISITRECLVKIERGIQHIQVQQLKAIKDKSKTSYIAVIYQVAATNKSSSANIPYKPKNKKAMKIICIIVGIKSKLFCRTKRLERYVLLWAGCR